MGLRDFLQNLQLGSQGFAGAAETGNEMRKQAALKDFAQNMPGQMAQGQYADVAAGMASMGDMTGVRELLGSEMKARDAKKSMIPFTASELQAQGVPFEKAQVFANMDFAKQKEAVSNFESARSSGLTQQGLNLQAQGQTRLEREEIQKQRNATRDRFGKLEKDLSEESRIFDKLDFVLKNPSQTGDAIVVNFLARNMAGEKGPLSNDDITRITGSSIWESADKAEQWLTASATSPLGSERRKVYNNLVKAARDNFSGYKKESILRTFNQAIEDNPKLMDSDKVDKSLEMKAKRLSEKTGSPIVFTKNEDGDLVATLGEAKKAPLNVMSKEGVFNVDAMMQQAELIEDVAQREKVKKAIQKNMSNSSSNKVGLNQDKIRKYYDSQIKPFLPKK
jgi:hypothetical protein